MIKTADLYKILKDVEKGKMSADSAEAQLLSQFTQQPKAHTVTAWVEIPIMDGGRFPQKEGPLMAIAKDPATLGLWYKNEDSFKDKETGEYRFTHWLEQVQLPIQGYSLEQVEAIWAAGVKYGEGVEDNLLPLYEIIKSLKQK